MTKLNPEWMFFGDECQDQGTVGRCEKGINDVPSLHRKLAEFDAHMKSLGAARVSTEFTVTYILEPVRPREFTNPQWKKALNECHTFYYVRVKVESRLKKNNWPSDRITYKIWFRDDEYIYTSTARAIARVKRLLKNNSKIQRKIPKALSQTSVVMGDSYVRCPRCGEHNARPDCCNCGRTLYEEK